jgi:ABC-type branched-subunit amino acid transport system substrate-binding protein
MRALAAILVALGIVAGGCGSSSKSAGTRTILVAVDAPFSQSPFIGNTIANGVQLAADQLAAQGLRIGDSNYRIEVVRLDNALSPAQAVSDTRRAIREHAAAVVTDGTGVDATWQLAAKENLPIAITYQGGSRLVDPDKRPNVFRIAPTDHGLAFRLAEYIVPKGLKVALLTDDSDYGQAGRAELDDAFATLSKSVAARITLPANATDLAPQVLEARRSRATALLVWSRPAVLAKTIAAARAAGWKVPVFSTPAAEDPVVRQQLADHPRWVDGLTFASGRMTAELGTGPWSTFAAAYESAYGPTYVGVRTRNGQRVTAPPDYAMYSYDFVNVLVAALQFAKGTDPKQVLAGLNQVSAHGANGDQRGFNERSHEGVVDDDVYFARYRDMTFRPVSDDPLSATLPVIAQTQTQ